MPPPIFTEKGTSTATLKRIKRNNSKLANLWVRQCKSDDTFTQFTSASGCDFALLGHYIEENTCLQSVAVEIIKVFTSNNTRSFTEFCNGLRHNSSIHKLTLDCSYLPIRDHGTIQDMLKVYMENNNLTCLTIQHADVYSMDCCNVIIGALPNLNLEAFRVTGCNVSGLYSRSTISHIVDEVRAHPLSKLDRLDFSNNLFGGSDIMGSFRGLGDSACESIAALLEDHHCNIRFLNLSENYFRHEDAMIIINSLAKNNSLQGLQLRTNNINDECAIGIANSLAINNNLQGLDLDGNDISTEGVIAIAKSLANNKSLRVIELMKNQVFDYVIMDTFSAIVCNTASIHHVHSSNHTLEYVGVRDEDHWPEAAQWHPLDNQLKLNKGTNKGHNAMKKILLYHPDFDIEKLYRWDSEGEQNLKALPYLLSWFERAEEAVADDDARRKYQIEDRKLSAVYQFARDMPWLVARDESTGFRGGGG